MRFLHSHDAISVVCYKLLLQIASCELALTVREFITREKVIKAAFTRDRIRCEPVRNWYEQALCLHGGSSADRICYLVPNGSTYEGDFMWNRTVPV